MKIDPGKNIKDSAWNSVNRSAWSSITNLVDNSVRVYIWNPEMYFVEQVWAPVGGFIK